MLSLRWPDPGTILALGAHSDDIEIGAGATLLRLVREHPRARIVWVVLAAAAGGGEHHPDDARPRVLAHEAEHRRPGADLDVVAVRPEAEDGAEVRPL